LSETAQNADVAYVNDGDFTGRVPIVFSESNMKRKAEEQEPERPGGKAAERLREFIDQRLPQGDVTPEGTAEKGKLDQQVQLYQIEQKLQELEVRIKQLEQIVQNLTQSKK
jgi:hypothetical protein